MAGVFELILAGIVDFRERPSIAEMATRLGVVLPRKIRSGPAGWTGYEHGRWTLV